MSFYKEYEKKQLEDLLNETNGKKRSRKKSSRYDLYEEGSEEEEIKTITKEGSNIMLCGGGCGNEVGPIHKCPDCHVHMHIYCGTPVGEEGFGQAVLCPKCKFFKSKTSG